ncbi:hypothetical protein BV22DRAFT_1046345 [Leucogyrophana mollusca]|uniref:Uncharacterized protein n=1 Tax=Leucogyrophana mollusca TaxID=85980 RepID=A0ACB8BN76_9AGAM|nr:hypothetical protein BV22DRAFT_1046345 [Leucogyrophana mollusca]
MRFSLLALFALFVATASPVAAEGLTNAERLARGLPILPPKFGRSVPGYARNPTPASPEKRVVAVSASPSPKPIRTEWFYKFTGRIKVVSYDGEPLGYLRNWATGSVSGVNAGGPSSELHVSFKAPRRGGDHLFSILATNPNFPAPYYIGTTTSATLAPGSPSSVAFGNVEQTPPKSPPVTSGNQTDESAIWSFDGKTNELTAHYVNPDGSPAKTTIAYNIWDNNIFFVGDIDAFNNATSDPDYLVSPVTFYLETL